MSANENLFADDKRETCVLKVQLILVVWRKALYEDQLNVTAE